MEDVALERVRIPPLHRFALVALPAREQRHLPHKC